MKIPMVDYLQFSARTENYEKEAELLLEKLYHLKEKAMELRANKQSDKMTIDIGSLTFEVMPNGSSGYAYLLHHAFYEMRLKKYVDTRNTDYYPIMVVIKSEALWNKGSLDAYIDIMELIQDEFGLIQANKVSRVDLCCHTDLIDFKHIELTRFIGKHKNDNTRRKNRAVTSFEFGSRSSKIYTRIYDKVEEVKQKKAKRWFYIIWKKHHWNNKYVWNIEFEMKRPFFNEFSIESVEDLFNSIGSIWEECTSSYLILKDIDRTRIENCSINPEWNEISESFNQYNSKSLIKRKEQLKADADVYVPATMGLIARIAACEETTDLNRALWNIKDKGTKYFENKDTSFVEKVQEKMNLLNEKGGEEIG